MSQLGGQSASFLWLDQDQSWTCTKQMLDMNSAMRLCLKLQQQRVETLWHVGQNAKPALLMPHLSSEQEEAVTSSCWMQNKSTVNVAITIIIIFFPAHMSQYLPFITTKNYVSKVFLKWRNINECCTWAITSSSISGLNVHSMCDHVVFQGKGNTGPGQFSN